MNFIKKRGPGRDVRGWKYKTFVRHTESDDDGNQHGRPEGELAEQDHNLVDKVDTLEQRVDGDPSHHDHGGADHDNPSDDRPAECAYISITSRSEAEKYALARVHADVGVCANNGGDRNRSTKVGEGFERLPVPRDGKAKSPSEVWDEEHDRRLVQSVQHVHPELAPRVLKSPDATDVQLGERERCLRVEILVEGWRYESAAEENGIKQIPHLQGQ